MMDPAILLEINILIATTTGDGDGDDAVFSAVVDTVVFTGREDAAADSGTLASCDDNGGGAGDGRISLVSWR